jgi:hypothetical protein
MLRLLGAVVLCVGLSGCVFYLNPLCTDQISNGSETGVDCGGGCGRCEIGDSCKVNADCEDSDCQGGTCTAFPCFNGKADGNEADVDCGGGECRTCSGGRECSVDSDCASGTCEIATNTCAGLELSFEASATYAAGDKPYALFSVDLDGDGDLDLVSADELKSELVVLGNDGAGTFTRVAGFLTGQYPTGGAIGDFNRDGVPDVITADYQGDSVSVLANVAGVLEPKLTYPTVDGGETSNLAIGDLDGDGDLDVIATNPQQASVSMFLGVGDGTLGPAANLPVGLDDASEPYSAAIADFDADGRNDVAIADSRSATIIVRLGNGDGTFQPEVAYADGGTPPLILITDDVNGDGRADLICANRGSDNVSVLLGRGDGTFRKPLLAPTGEQTGPYAVAVADFNRDGILDLVTGNYKITPMPLTFSDASVLLGIGNGNFEEPFILPGSPAYGVAVGDFNADGKPDFGAANFANQTVTVKLNTSQ